ncbi:MAG: hypothetical protein AAGF90_08805 [Pseudomonadota bacterium]
MTFLAALVACGVIGWFVPAVAVKRMPSTLGAVLGVVAALALGAGAVWLTAQAAAALGSGDARAAFDRGFNAWKFMILLAPAAALHARRAQGGAK